MNSKQPSREEKKSQTIGNPPCKSSIVWPRSLAATKKTRLAVEDGKGRKEGNQSLKARKQEQKLHDSEKMMDTTNRPGWHFVNSSIRNESQIFADT
jgi:hypothetical protein